MSETAKAWGSEDGDEWFAAGHVDLEVMVELVRDEQLDAGVDDEDQPRYTALVVTHYWVLERGDDAYDVVAPGTAKAEPMTWCREASHRMATSVERVNAERA